MTTVTAGNTSAVIRSTNENDLIVINPAASSKGYAEISYDNSSWAKWSPLDVISRTELPAGIRSPYVRAKCISGSLDFELTFAADTDTRSDLSAELAAMGLPITVAASISATAAANTTAIQAALDAAHIGATTGIFIPPGLGDVLVNGGIVYGNNAIISVGAGTNIKLADNANTNMFISRPYRDNVRLSIVNSINALTAGSASTDIGADFRSVGYVITAVVPNTNTYLPAVGDVVSVWNAGFARFGWVGHVLSAQASAGSTWTFCYKVRRPPRITTAPGIASGMQYCQAVQRIKFSGLGSLDGNVANNSASNYPLAGIAIVALHVYDFQIDDGLEIKNSLYRGVHIAQARRAKTNRFRITNLPVGLQTCGTLIDCEFAGIDGNGNTDDRVALMDKEAPGFPLFAPCEGDLINVKITGLSGFGKGGASTPGRAFALYSMSQLYENDVKVVEVNGAENSAMSYYIGGDGSTTAGRTAQINGVNDIIDLIKIDTNVWDASRPVAAQDLTNNAQVATYVAAIGDAGKRVTITAAGANNFTIPANATVAFPVGTRIQIKQGDAGATTIVAAGGVTIYGLARTIGKFDDVTIDGSKVAGNLGPEIVCARAQRMTINNLDAMSDSGNFVTQWFPIDAFSSVAELTFNRLRNDYTGEPGGFSYLIFDQSTNATETRKFIDCSNSIYLSAMYARVGNAGLRTLLFERCRAVPREVAPGSGGGWFLYTSTGQAAWGTITFRDCYGSTSSSKIILQSSATLVLENCKQEYCGTFASLGDAATAMTFEVKIKGHDLKLNNGGDSVITVRNAAIANVYGEFDPPNGVLLASIQAGGTLNPKSLGLRLDVSATGVGKSVGNLAYHNGAINPGPAYADGTNWRRMYDAAVIV